MPITVIVRSGDGARGEAPKLTFDGTQRVVIGRGSSCDVRLPDPSVSHRHATLQASGVEFVIVDEGSTNGTWVGRVRVAARTSRVVRSGDLVRVGRVWLEVRVERTEATRDVARATRELALALVAHAMGAMGDETTPKVRVVEGCDEGEELLLAEEGRVYVIGRAPECDLPLADADASRKNTQVVRRGGAVLVRDRESKNGTWLGETQLPRDRDTPWRATTMLRIGRTVLALQEPVAAALSELEEAPDEPMPPDEPPPPPPPTLVSAAPPGAPEDDAPQKTGAPRETPARSPKADRPRPRARNVWNATDVMVVVAALGVLGLSIAGLVWLLRG
jgi:pSer/pThr/pTyr-binding forkhead associated (FHA) protein